MPRIGTLVLSAAGSSFGGPELPFRFDAAAHVYTALDTGEELPHITGMLEHVGLVDSRWYTLDSQFRGSCVHRLTADYDLGAITDVATVTSAFSGWLQAHDDFMRRVKPKVIAVEEPCVHAYYRYGCRPDRVERLYSLLSVVEIKSGVPEFAHQIQTALQALAVAQEHGDGMPAEMWGRFALYLKENGKWFLEQHRNLKDFDQAREIIHECCHR
jgi:hypothetical protein